jgi:hypothetical protein
LGKGGGRMCYFDAADYFGADVREDGCEYLMEGCWGGFQGVEVARRGWLVCGCIGS